MSSTPSNPKLYALVVFQAKAKFNTYPSPAASHWVHEEYTTKGGTFSESTAATAQLKRASEAVMKKRREHAAAKADKKKGHK